MVSGTEGDKRGRKERNNKRVAAADQTPGNKESNEFTLEVINRIPKHRKTGNCNWLMDERLQRTTASEPDFPVARKMVLLFS